VSQYADLCKRLQMYDKTWFTAPAEAAAAITQLERELAEYKQQAMVRVEQDRQNWLDYTARCAERDAALKREQELRTRCEALEAAVRLSIVAMRAPLDKWKGELERPALDACNATIAAREVPNEQPENGSEKP